MRAYRTGYIVLTVSALLLGVCGAGWSASPVAWWRFEPEAGGVATDSVNGVGDQLLGNRRYSDSGVQGKCLKLDGFTTHVRRGSEKAPKLPGAFSIEAWVALQQYPWNWTAIVDRQSGHKAGYFFGIDYQGAIGLKAAVDGKWVECANSVRDYNSILHTNGWDNGAVHTMIRSDRKLQFSLNGVGDLDSSGRIPSNAWTHVAVVYSRSSKSCKIFVNGKLDSTYPLNRPVTAVLGNLQIGGWDGGDRNYKGKMDDLRIYGRALSDAEAAELAAGKGPADSPAAWWKFDETGGATAADSAGGKNGDLVGATFGAGKVGNALELDGTNQCVRVPPVGKFDDFTLAVWVNPEIESAEIPLHTWTHVVGAYDPAAGMAIYMNGKLVGSKPVRGGVTEPAGTDLLIGLSHEKLAPIQTERGPSMVGSHMLLDGLIDEVKIYDSALSPAQVSQAYASVKPRAAKPLSYWQMPTGPLGKAEFGASYNQLAYGDSWDENFRAGETSDVVVKFDELPVNYVFWKGWNYGQCMVSENGLLMADQSVERGNENGCVEHMSDKQNRYAYINIIENNDARVVLHWRYAPCDIFYKQVEVDSKTGWGDWCDEYFYIYPDGVMMRDQKAWSTGYVEHKRVGGYGGDPSVQETLFFSQPGKGPLDTVDVGALTLANDAGQTKTYAWQPEFPWQLNRDQPATLTIQMVNFKSQYKPFMLHRPGGTVAAFPPSGFIDRNFPYWNHWPVSQLPNDGRKGTRTDRPAHTSLTWFCEPATSQGILHSWLYMYGLTTKPAAELGTLSKSWSSPAKLTVESGNCASGGYDQYQRAYQLTCEKPGNPTELKITLNGGDSSPVLNPAFVIKNWGDAVPRVAVNGTSVPRSKACRLGIQRNLEGSDLVVWLKQESTKPITINLAP